MIWPGLVVESPGLVVVARGQLSVLIARVLIHLAISAASAGGGGAHGGQAQLATCRDPGSGGRRRAGAGRGSAGERRPLKAARRRTAASQRLRLNRPPRACLMPDLPLAVQCAVWRGLLQEQNFTRSDCKRPALRCTVARNSTNVTGFTAERHGD